MKKLNEEWLNAILQLEKSRYNIARNIEKNRRIDGNRNVMQSLNRIIPSMNSFANIELKLKCQKLRQIMENKPLIDFTDQWIKLEYELKIFIIHSTLDWMEELIELSNKSFYPAKCPKSLIRIIRMLKNRVNSYKVGYPTTFELNDIYNKIRNHESRK